jgi:hypothetical protein
MAESKYGKYVMTTDLLPVLPPGKQNTSDQWTRLTYLDSSSIKGAFYVECLWFWKGSDTALNKAHTHDFDEVITFYGSNPEDPIDLGGEVELWLGDEKHVFTKSVLVFVPKGLSHCPLTVRRVDRPIFHFPAGPANIYLKGEG